LIYFKAMTFADFSPIFALNDRRDQRRPVKSYYAVSEDVLPLFSNAISAHLSKEINKKNKKNAAKTWQRGKPRDFRMLFMNGCVESPFTSPGKVPHKKEPARSGPFLRSLLIHGFGFSSRSPIKPPWLRLHRPSAPAPAAGRPE
jgi:hypothetical protein